MPITIKPKPFERRDKFFTRCMGDKQMTKEFPDNKIRGGVCGGIFDKKKNQLTTLNFHANFHITRKAIVDGVEYVIAPVIAIVEGVHHGSTGREFYSADELSKNVEAWNGMPLTIDHPERDGQRVSASDPEIAEKFLVGKFYNVVYEGGKLKGEIWVEVDRIKRLSPETLVMIETGKPLEVSTGLFAFGDGMGGNWNGEEFDNTLYDFSPDHLALLPNDVGACSIADGCGVRMNCANCKKRGGEKNVVVAKKVTLKAGDVSQIEEEYSVDIPVLKRHLEQAGFRVLELSHGKMREQIHRALSEMDKPGTMRFLREVFDDFFIFELVHDNDNPKLFRQGYSFNKEDEIKFKDDPVEVKEKVEFIELSSNSNIKKEVVMERKEQIEALINNQLITYQIGDEEKLNEMSDERFADIVTLGEKLAKCECDEQGNIIGNKEEVEKDDSEELKTLQDKTETAEKKVKTLQDEKEEAEKEVKTLKAEKEEADKKPASFEDVLATANDATKEMIQSGIRANREKKDSLIKVLVDNEKNPFSKEDLEKKPMDELENLVSFAGTPVDYSGRGGALPRVNKKDPHERQPDGSGVPLVPEMKWNKDGSPDYSHLNG